MAKKEEKHGIRDWWDGLTAEFGKIVWPDKDTIAKQSTATILVSLVMGLIIVFFDMIIQYGVDFLVDFKI